MKPSNQIVTLGVAGINVPPNGTTIQYKVEKRFNKSAIARRVRAESNPKIAITIGRSNDSPCVSNVALSLLTADKPLPVYLTEGDYLITFSSISDKNETVNLAFDTELI